MARKRKQADPRAPGSPTRNPDGEGRADRVWVRFRCSAKEKTRWQAEAKPWGGMAALIRQCLEDRRAVAALVALLEDSQLTTERELLGCLQPGTLEPDGAGTWIPIKVTPAQRAAWLAEAKGATESGELSAMFRAGIAAHDAAKSATALLADRIDRGAKLTEHEVTVLRTLAPAVFAARYDEIKRR